MEHDARSLINLSNFLVARWSRIKDRQMNRSVDGEEGEREGVTLIQGEGVMDRPCHGP